MKKISRLFGMAWSTPVVRTVVQAAVGAGLAILVAAGTDFSGDVFKLAFAASIAGALAKLQEMVRG